MLRFLTVVAAIDHSIANRLCRSTYGIRPHISRHLTVRPAIDPLAVKTVLTSTCDQAPPSEKALEQYLRQPSFDLYFSSGEDLEQYFQDLPVHAPSLYYIFCQPLIWIYWRPKKGATSSGLYRTGQYWVQSTELARDQKVLDSPKGIYIFCY
jgi:hypothetical protein